ncbi:MAG: nucleotidyl transferase AbiEii/AbiGii toxin family protein [Acidimicrobiales bacterium]
MCRVGGEHRPTLDIDSAFNNETDTPTTALLVADGIATAGDAIQRVRIDDTLIDVIDTFPIVAHDLPDDLAQRLFVCAHRFAYESATPVTFVGTSNRATVRVASVEALISMKAHALRFGRPQRRATKRSSDLYDVIRLVTAGSDGLLIGAPWALRQQVRDAMAEDLADLPAAFAVLQGSLVQTINEITADLLELVVKKLLDRLR